MSSSPSTTGSAVTPHLALIAVQVMFGTWPIIGKIALRSMSSTSLVGFRVFGAALIFSLLQRKVSQIRHLPKRVLAWLLLSGLRGEVESLLASHDGIGAPTGVTIRPTLCSNSRVQFLINESPLCQQTPWEKRA